MTEPKGWLDEGRSGVTDISDAAMTARVSGFLERVRVWAEAQPGVVGLALVGSYARDEAGANSDVDLVLLTSRPQDFVADPAWTESFGAVVSCRVEDWGRVTSLRVYYEDGLEVEYGIAPAEWARVPLDVGTRQVIAGGMRILLDRGGRLGRALEGARD